MDRQLEKRNGSSCILVVVESPKEQLQTSSNTHKTKPNET